MYTRPLLGMRRITTWRWYVIYPDFDVKLHIREFHSNLASIVNNQFSHRFPDLVKVYRDKLAVIGVFSYFLEIPLKFNGLRV